MPSSIALVLRAAFASLAPPRLAWGALVVIVAVAAGRMLDIAYLAMGGRPVSPSGLAVGGWSDEQRKNAHRSAASAVAAFTLGTAAAQESIGVESEPSAMRAALDSAFIERSEKASSGPPASLESRYRQIRASIDGLRPRGPSEALGEEVAAALRRIGAACVALAPLAVLDAAIDGFWRAPSAFVRFAPWYALIAGVPLAAIVSVLAGGLARMTVWEAGRGVKLGVADAAMFVRAAALRLALVPVLPAALVALGLLVMAAIGALLRVPVLDLAGGVLYGLVVLVSFVLVVTSIGFVVGWPLALASVAAGDGDAVDSLVRATSYVLRRPGYLVAMAASAILAVAIGMAVAGGVAALSLGLAETATGFWGGTVAAQAAGDAGLLGPAVGTPPIDGRTARAAGAFIDLWELIVVLLVAGAAASVVVDAATRAYLMLRRACDGQDLSALDGVPLGRPKVD